MSANPRPIIPTCTIAAARGGPGGAATSKPRSGSAISRQAAARRRYSMTGSRRRGVILQNRDRHLLAELGVMRIIDREMTKLVAGFGSTTQVNTRLLELTRAGLLRRFFVGSIGAGRKAIYTLSPKGEAVVSAKLGGIHRASG